MAINTAVQLFGGETEFLGHCILLHKIYHFASTTVLLLNIVGLWVADPHK